VIDVGKLTFRSCFGLDWDTARAAGMAGFLSTCLVEITAPEKETVVGSSFCCNLFCARTPFVSDEPILATILFNEARGLCNFDCFSIGCLTVIFCLTIGGSGLVLISLITGLRDAREDNVAFKRS